MDDPEITASEARRDPLAGQARGVMRVVDALTQTALVVATATLAWALWRRSDAYAWFGGLGPGTAVTLAVLVTLVALLGVWMGVRTWRRVG